MRTANRAVTTRGYNYRIATALLDSTVSVRNDAVMTGEYYRYASPFLEASDDIDSKPATESKTFYARLHHERELNKSARFI